MWTRSVFDPRVECDTYKLEEERVFPESSNAPCKSQNEHHSSHHKEEPDRVKAAEIGDGRDVGQNSLGAEKNTEQGGGAGLVLQHGKITAVASAPPPGETAAVRLAGAINTRVAAKKKKTTFFPSLDGFIF